MCVSFKTVESHYGRKNIKYQYLPSSLTLLSMHQCTSLGSDEKNYTPISYNTYHTITQLKQFDTRIEPSGLIHL